MAPQESSSDDFFSVSLKLHKLMSSVKGLTIQKFPLRESAFCRKIMTNSNS